jgi:hypothetical protein
MRERKMSWTKESIIEKLNEIKAKGFIPVPDIMFRKDDGIVGQILEYEFGITENNLQLSDLGKYELKSMRSRKGRTNMLTLGHQTSSSGMTPIEIFNRFGYVRKSNRSDIMKKKLFTTIKGDKHNNLGFKIGVCPKSDKEFSLYYKDEHLAKWDMSAFVDKVQNIVLVFAEPKGKTNSPDEQFHYNKAYMLSGLKCIREAILSGALVMDLCIDKPVDSPKQPHDRGPHIRIPIHKLSYLFDNVEQIL